jgi:hypothetical protein
MVALALTEADRAKWLKKAKTWSNVGGLVLTPVRPNVWALERPFTWLGIDVGSKATVVRLSDGSLWVHSPIELDADTKAAVDELGPVKFIVTPNYEHMKFAQQESRPWPYTLHPTPCTLHPTSYTLHPTPYTLHPTP